MRGGGADLKEEPHLVADDAPDVQSARGRLADAQAAGRHPSGSAVWMHGEG